MITPRRRSSRLRGNTPQAEAGGGGNGTIVVSSNVSPSKLPTLSEVNERSDRNERKGELKDSDEVALPNIPGSFPDATNMTVTPTSAFRLRPSSEEMHPKHFQNTALKAASERRLSKGIGNEEPDTPSRFRETDETVTRSSPFRPSSSALAKSSFPRQSFDFRCNRPSTGLSSEAQRMMDEVRMQAAKIRDELIAQRNAQRTEDFNAEILAPGTARKIAKPKGRIGRYSDVHLQEFKKMPSIANHASAFRADPLRAPPSSIKSLKRTNSKAELDASSPITSQSAKVHKTSYSDSPVKRFKARSGAVKESPASLNHLTTPTKASVARSSGVNNRWPGTVSKIPTFSRSPSVKALATPTTTRIFYAQSEGNNRVGNAFTRKLAGSVKSILRRPRFNYSDDPVKLAAGTHVATPKSAKIKNLPDVPIMEPVSPAHRKEKHVNFSPSPPTIWGADNAKDASPGTPSPAKRVTNYPVLYPALPGVSSADPASPTPVSATATKFIGGRGDFTFRADQNVIFGQASKSPFTIRKVGASDEPLPIGLHVHHKTDFPSVAHGLGNKKRKRVSPDPDDIVKLDTGEDKENAGRPEGQPSKKSKIGAISPGKKHAPPASATPTETPTKRAVKAKGKSVLSLSRLNTLARPKNRI